MVAGNNASEWKSKCTEMLSLLHSMPLGARGRIADECRFLCYYHYESIDSSTNASGKVVSNGIGDSNINQFYRESFEAKNFFILKIAFLLDCIINLLVSLYSSEVQTK